MSRTGAWIATGAVIAAAWLLAWYVGLRPAEQAPPEALFDAALLDATPIPYTPVTRARPPRFRLLGGERQLKLITHAVADARGPLDADEVVVYGVRLTLVDLVGEVLWSGALHTSGRRSVDPRQPTVGGVPARPDAALVDDPQRAVYDSRLLQFQIPRIIPPESRLVVEPIGDAERVLVRLYAREAPRRGIGFKARDLLRDEAPPVDDMLAERVPRSLRWVRRSSEVPTVTVLRTGNRRPFDENEVKAFVPVDPLRPLAINVEGPTPLELRVMRGTDAETAAGPGVGSVNLTDVPELGAEGVPAGLDVAIPETPGVEAVARFEVGPGVHSLRVRTARVGGARIRLTAPGTRLDAARTALPGTAPPPVRFGDVPVVPYEDTELALPDERRFPVFVAEPGGAPVVVGIEGPDDDLARLIRLDTRLMAPLPIIDAAAMARGADDPAHLRSLRFAPSTVEVVWLDADGRRLGQRALSVDSPAALFEEVERPDGTRLKVSEPQGLRLAVPAGTARIEIRAPDRLNVRPHVLFPAPPPHLALPYRAHLPDGHIWRYAPREFRTWYPVSPLNRDALRAEGAVLTMVAQVRLEPAGADDGSGEASSPPDPPRSFSPIDPVGRPAQQRVLEDVRRDRVGAVRRAWGPGLRAEVPPGLPVRFRVDRGDRSRPRLTVALDGDARALLGEALTVAVDGAPGGRVVLGATRFAWSLPALPPGWHTLDLGLEGGGALPSGLSLQIDRATGSTRIFHLRTLYALGAGGLDVRVPLDADGVVLNAIVYDRRTRAVPEARLTAVIDGGAPQRRRGVPVESFTLATARAPLAEARRPVTTARLVDRALQSVGHPRTFAIRLGPDLVRGSHTVRVRAEADRGLWVRFIIAEDRVPRREAARSGTFTEAE